MFYPPFLIFFLFLFIFILIISFGMVQVGLFSWAFAKLGIPPEYLFSLLFLCIMGSMINIPIRKVRVEDAPADWEIVSFFGLRFRPPRLGNRREMVLAVNIGGAVIPSLISLYLLAHSPNAIRMTLALAAVSWVVHRVARPVPGIGIATPMFVPPLAAALAALLVNMFSGHPAAPTAYVAGTLGTLIGADILHLNQLRELKAPVVSIGGAGTFDGIFLTGILAVLLA
jgi:uncharacterized membrane protein